MESALITRTYDVNRGNAAKAVGPAADFFRLLGASSSTFHVMVHSMGHQVVLPALAKAAKDWDRPLIGELILNAPDIQLKDFQRLVVGLRKAAERITVYCSYNDNAIAASETYNKNRRLGACERVPGVDVINVGEIDAPALGLGGLGHGYYASRPILTDIHQVLLGIDAQRRLFIRRSEPNSTEDFYLRP
jgi:esterase/lipase superfamily enzyme